MGEARQCQGMTIEGKQCARRVAHPPYFCPDHRGQAPVVGQVGFDGALQRLAVEARGVRGGLAPRSREAPGPLQDSLVDLDEDPGEQADPEDPGRRPAGR